MDMRKKVGGGGGGCRNDPEARLEAQLPAASPPSFVFDFDLCGFPSFPLTSTISFLYSVTMAVGSLPDAPFDPTSATSYGDNFYPKQTDPNKTILPPRPAPLTASNLWQAIKVR